MEALMSIWTGAMRNSTFKPRPVNVAGVFVVVVTVHGAVISGERETYVGDFASSPQNGSLIASSSVARHKKMDSSSERLRIAPWSLGKAFSLPFPY